MKIVNVIFTSQNGGAEQVFIDYITVLKNLGHDVLGIVEDDAPYAEKLSQLGVPVRKIKNRFGDYDYFAVKEIKKILKTFAADAVVAHIGRAMVLTSKAIKKIKNKKIFLIAVNHSMNVKRSIGADLVFSVNKEIFYRTIELGQDEKKSFIMPNALDLSDAPSEFSQIDFREKDKIVIGVMGRIDETKGFNTAIEAIYGLRQIARVQKLEQKFMLKIAGAGPREGFLRSLVQNLDLDDEVEFLGWVQNKKDFFQSIDIFCLPSQNETFGLVLLEAMKYRKPITASATDGAKEILRDGIDGLLFDLEPAENIHERLIGTILRIVGDPFLANKMVENSFARLKERYSFQALERRMKEVFGTLRS
jgi:glycosyltransferase involved in cell wall biosynthesis